jgi:hypothetical protein
MKRGRATARERGYDHTWVQACRQFKAMHPLCVGCLAIGVMRATEVVDHIVPHRGDRTLFWDRNNWQASCGWHHNAVKPILERSWSMGTSTVACLQLNSPEAIRLTKAKHRPEIGADGYPIAGT